MEIQNRHQEAEISGIQASSFGFEMNAKMYDILISKMYTNKPAAVIRELSANAWDAHVEAGNSDKPFELHLPTWLDKTFSIRDYGTGIPHDRFEHIYTNVGKSTKEGTNDLIGGFGLGSKAPFTMTDTFTVENWHGGIKTTWVCFKDKGVPQVSKISEEPSDEPSGLKVSFAFDEGDVSEFTKQVPIQLRFFPVKPVITGGAGSVEYAKLPDGWDNPNKPYFFVNEGGNGYYYQRPCFVVMGNVSYKLDPSYFPSNFRDIFSVGVILRAPIGAVDIPPSREHLEMTPRTIAAITDILTLISADYEAETKARLDACTTVLEARKVVADLNCSLLSRSFRQDYMIHGVSFAELLAIAINNIKGYGLQGYVRLKRSSNYAFRAAAMRIKELKDDEVILYVNDLGTGGQKHLELNALKVKNASSKNPYIVQLHSCKPKEHPDALAECIRVVSKEYGTTPILLSSVIGMPVKGQAKATVKAEANQIYKVTASRINTERSVLQGCTEVTDIPKEGYYLELSGHVVQTKIDNITGILQNGTYTYLDKPLYLVRKKTIPKLTGLTELTDDILDVVRKQLLPIAIQKAKVLHALSFTYNMPPDYVEILKGVKNKQLRAFIRYSAYLTNKNEKIPDVRAAVGAIKGRGFSYNPPEVKDKLKEVRASFEDVREVLGNALNTYCPTRRQRRINALKLITNL